MAIIYNLFGLKLIDKIEKFNYRFFIIKKKVNKNIENQK